MKDSYAELGRLLEIANRNPAWVAFMKDKRRYAEQEKQKVEKPKFYLLQPDGSEVAIEPIDRGHRKFVVKK